MSVEFRHVEPTKEMMESLGEEYSGWVYKDFPKSFPVTFEKVMKIIGEENMKVLSFAQYPFSDERFPEEDRLVRGQFLISPTGMENLQDFVDNPTNFDKEGIRISDV